MTNSDRLRVEYIPLDIALLWDNNKKRHDIGGLIRSFQTHGFKDPAKFEPTLNGGAGGIAEGNGRFTALAATKRAIEQSIKRGDDDIMSVPRGIEVLEDGRWAIPVLFGVDAASEAAAESYAIDHNALTLAGGDFDLTDHLRMWEDGFVADLKGLAELDELPVTFDFDDLDALLAFEGMEDVPDDPGPQIDKAAELQEKWGVEVGDLWQIGDHRLVCGDCTDADIVARVMGGERADCVLTDPPYGIGQAGVPGDEPEGLHDLIDGCVPLLPIENAVCVAFQSTRTFPVWLDAIRNNGHKFERILSLYKEAQCTFPWRGWILKSESILVSTVGRGDWQDVHPYHHDAYSVSEVSGELPEDVGWHGSVKPLEVVIDILGRVVGEGKLVYDPFAGSGTTGVACERLGRQARMVEIHPPYCSVILERLQGLGLTPERVGSDLG